MAKTHNTIKTPISFDRNDKNDLNHIILTLSRTTQAGVNMKGAIIFLAHSKGWTLTMK